MRSRNLIAATAAGAAFAIVPAGALASTAGGDLMLYGNAGSADAQSQLAAGTSPAIAGLTGGGYEIAYQNPGTDLRRYGTAGSGSLRLGMMSGTSPAIAALTANGYEIAFQANTASLWTTGTAGGHDWALGMMPGSSPAIAGLSNGGFEAAFEANSEALWAEGAGAGAGDEKLGLWDRTSPAITALGSGYEIAFQSQQGSLWVANPIGTGIPLGMMAGTSPSIAQVQSTYVAAFQADTGILWTYSPNSKLSADTTLRMAHGTNPSIAGLTSGGDEVAYQCSNGDLCTHGSDGTTDTGDQMAPGTSPSIAGLAGGGYEIAYQGKPPPTPGPVVTTVPNVPSHRRGRHLHVRLRVRWIWAYRRTRLDAVHAHRLPHGARIAITCRGRGCPEDKRLRGAMTLRRFNRLVDGRVFRAGDVLLLTISARRYRTERVRFLIRNGAIPAWRVL